MTEKWGYDVALSERANELLGLDTFGQIMQLVKDEIKEEIFQHPTSERRDELYYEMHALSRIQIKIQSIVDSVKNGRGN